jgi:hypothetical protein
MRSKLLLVAFLGICPAWAGYLTDGYLTVNDIDRTRGEYLDWTLNGSRFNSFAGVLLGLADFRTSIDLLSADPFHSLPPGTYISMDTAPMIGTIQQRIAWLFAYQIATVTDPHLGAGLQLAIWDLVMDNGNGPNAGLIQLAPATPPAVVTAWQNYLTVSQGQTLSDASFFYNRSIIFGGTRATTVGRFGGPLSILPPTPPTEEPPVIPPTVIITPEPATWFLLAAGIGALAKLKRRK